MVDYQKKYSIEEKDYFNLYQKYKKKYLDLKKLIGGSIPDSSKSMQTNKVKKEELPRNEYEEDEIIRIKSIQSHEHPAEQGDVGRMRRQGRKNRHVKVEKELPDNEYEEDEIVRIKSIQSHEHPAKQGEVGRMRRQGRKNR